MTFKLTSMARAASNALVLSLALMLATVANVRADIIDLRVSADRTEIEVGAVNIVNLTWEGAATDRFEGLTFVSSPTGQFVNAQGTILSTVRAAYSERLLDYSVVDMRAPFTFRESLVIDPALSRLLADTSSARVIYQREFSDGAGSATASLVLTFASGATGNLVIEAIDLRFDDRSRARVIPEHAELGAYGRMRFSGNGLAEFRWEIADPSSTSGIPVYRTLAVERQYLNALQQVTVVSPPLPSFTNGWFSLRLIARTAQGALQTATINYYAVSATRDDTSTPLKTIQTDNTQPDASIADTVFRWTPVADAVAYKLELLERQAAPVTSPESSLLDPRHLISEEVISPREGGTLTHVTAMYLLATPSPETPLSTLNRNAVAADGKYLWRILAYAEDGALIGASALKPIKFIE